MKEKNELLMHIYETCDMGVKSTTKLIDLLRDKDNKIKKLLEDELKEYEKYLVKSEKLLKKNSVKQAQLLYMLLAMALAYLVGSFILSFVYL